MYWIYFTIFIFIVFVPSIIQHGFYIFNAAQTQELTILFLGFVGFLAFIAREKGLKKYLAEKTKVQQQANRMTKDLTQSYSYIGEINRKLDILEQIILSYPDSGEITAKKQREMYDSIMEAIRLLGKSNEFFLRFISVSDREILKEIKSFSGPSFGFSCKNTDTPAQFFESDEILMTTSPKAIDNVISCIVIKKKTPNQKIEDLEILKAVASQSLFFFMFIRRKKQIASASGN